MYYYTVAPPTIISIYPTPPLILDSFTLGLPLNYDETVLTCLAFGAPELTSVDWLKINSQGGHSSRVTSHRSGLYSADLAFPNGFRVDDVGSYVCTATSNDRTSRQSSQFTLGRSTRLVLPVVQTPCSVNTDMVFFQIHIINTSCSIWDESAKEQALFAIQQSVVGVLTAQCEACNPGSLELNMEPVCSGQNTIVNGTISGNTQDVFCALDSWYRSGSTVRLRNGLYLIDHRCTLKIDSLTDDVGCAKEVAIGQQLAPAIVGSAASVGGLLVIGGGVAVIVIVIAALYIRRRYDIFIKHTGYSVSLISGSRSSGPQFNLVQ